MIGQYSLIIPDYRQQGYQTITWQKGTAVSWQQARAFMPRPCFGPKLSD